MPVQLDTKVKRKCFGFGNKIRIEELPDGTTTEDFQDWNLTFGCARAPRARERERRRREVQRAFLFDSSWQHPLRPWFVH